MQARPPHQNWWQQWLHLPQRSRLHTSLFHVHFWIGSMAGVYVTLISLTGSIVIFENDFPESRFMAWLVKFHTNLHVGPIGRMVNGIGGMGLTLLCLTGAIIWWPGVKYWRRSLRVDWRTNFPRFNWDLHSALGFWTFPLILIWGVSAIYFAFPQAFSFLFALDPADRITDQWLFRLSEIHFGLFTRLTKALWAALGLVPGLLAFTGTVICCRRVIFKKPSNPYHARK